MKDRGGGEESVRGRGNPGSRTWKRRATNSDTLSLILFFSLTLQGDSSTGQTPSSFITAPAGSTFGTFRRFRVQLALRRSATSSRNSLFPS